MKQNKVRIKIPLIVSLCLFVICILIGYLLPDDISKPLMQYLESYLGNVEFSFFGIFLNNLTASLLILAGGIFLAVPSLLLGAVNFTILGVAMRQIGGQKGIGLFLVSVLPHGVFELTAIILSLAYSLVIAGIVIGAVSKSGNNETSIKFGYTIKRYLTIVVPLLLIAGLIETYVTLGIVRQFAGK